MLQEIKVKLDSLKAAKRPFAEEPPLNAETTWVKPKLVAEIKFSQWTKEGNLRLPVFLRLREDKSASEILRTPVIEPSSNPQKRPSEKSDNVVQELEEAPSNFMLQVEGNKIRVTNLDKVLWPAIKGTPAITKRHLLIYLARISPYFLLHLKDRPLTLNRYPNGIYGQHFYQRHWNHSLPDFVDRVKVTGDDGKKSEYIVCNNLSTLLWLGQQGNLEFNCWFSRTNPQPDMAKGIKDIESILEYPDFIIFDLDPYLYSGNEAAGEEPELNRKAFKQAGRVALWLKEVLEGLSLNAYVKTSGKTGLHIHVPVIRELDYKAVRKAAEIIGRYLTQKHKDEITMEWAVEKRTGKVFMDYNQNVRGKSLASIYSPRPAPHGTVSAPLHWEEVDKTYPTDFTILTLPERLKKYGDLWAGILHDKHDLRTSLKLI
jgi:bifunctional non-homologous end joining protein LigD